MASAVICILMRAFGSDVWMRISGGEKPSFSTASSIHTRDIIAGAALMIAEIMIETDHLDLAGLQKFNGLIRPIDPLPTQSGV